MVTTADLARAVHMGAAAPPETVFVTEKEKKRIGKGVVPTTRRRGGGGGRGVTPAPTFESQLLQQSFGSQQAKVLAEASFRAKQQQRVEATAKAQAQRSARIQSEFEGTTVQRQTAPGVYKQIGPITLSKPDTRAGFGLGGTTLGGLSLIERERRAKGLISGFESLTPEQAMGKFMAGEKGFTGMSTPEGEIISFDTSAFEPEIKQAGSLKSLGKKHGIVEFGKAAVGSAAIGAGKFGLGVPEFVAETVVLGGMRPPGPGPQIAYFDKPTNIFGKAKQIPTDVVQIGTQIGLTAAVFAPGIISGVKLAKAEGVTTALGETAFTYSPGRPSKRFFTPDIKTELAGQLKTKGVQFPSGESVSVTTGRGALTKDVQIKSIGLGGKGRISGEVTALETPFLEIAPGGKITTGKITSIAGDVFKPTTTKEFPSAGYLGRDTFVEFPTTKVFKSTRGQQNIFSGSRQLGKETVLQMGEIPLVEREAFIFGAGRNLLTQRGGITGRGGKVLIGEEPFMAEVSGRGMITKFTNPFLETTGPTKSFSIGKGGLGTKTKMEPQTTQFSSAGLSSNLGKISKSIQVQKPMKTDLGLIATPQPSQYAGKGLYERTDLVSFAPQKFGGQTLFGEQVFEKTFQNPVFTELESPLGKVGQIGGIIITGTGRQRGGIVGGGVGQIQPVLSRQADIQAITPIQPTIQSHGQKQKQAFFEPPRGALFDFTPISPRGGGFIFPFLIPGLGFGEGPLGRVPKAKRKFKRKPSLVSFELDIQAPEPLTGELSGLVARPIISKRKKRRK